MESKQKVGLLRNTIDKYYTNPNVVDLCIKKIREYLHPTNEDILIEPSAGNGSFIKGMKEMSNRCEFYDIEPENNEIVKQDYMELNLERLLHETNLIHVIGNPPFGRQSSMAIKFIKQSCKFANSISFILPKSFKKDSMQKHFPLDFHLIFEQDIEENGFLVDDNVYHVPCVFQIWQRKGENRSVSETLIPKGFQFVKKSENPDIAFRRVGVYAGNIFKEEIENKSEQSHYFIKFDEKIPESTIEQLNTIVFDSRDNTVGPRSISKQELMKHYNTYF
tara:strand:- start:12800 stop:13630 length:831 start_codon:yes stop_codon:yes gene_type:complete